MSNATQQQPVYDEGIALADFVYSYLRCRSPDLAENFRQMYDPTRRAPHVTPVADMNRFWRMQFSVLPDPTQEIRECLDDSLSLVSYLAVLSNYLLPAAIHYQLPQQWKLYVYEFPPLAI